MQSHITVKKKDVYESLHIRLCIMFATLKGVLIIPPYPDEI